MNHINFAYTAFLDMYYLAAIYNTKTDELFFLKSNARSFTPEQTCHLEDIFFSRLMASNIHPDDFQDLIHLFSYRDKNSLLSALPDSRQITFRVKSNGLIHWYRLTVAGSEHADYGEEDTVLLLLQELSEQEIDIEDVYLTCRYKTLKIMKYDFNAGDIVTILEPGKEAQFRSFLERKGMISNPGLFAKSLIYPEDLKRISIYTKTEFLEKHFTNGGDEINLLYRRKIGHFYRWVHLNIVRSHNYCYS